MPPYPPPEQLSVVDWAQIMAAIGQCVSGLAAATAAWFAFYTIREMREQSKLTKQELITTHGPKIQIRWSTENALTDPYLPIFPLTEAEIEAKSSGDRSIRNAFTSLAEWWSNPSTHRPHPTSYVMFEFSNTQTDGYVGTARDIQGIIKLHLRKVQRGSPDFQHFHLIFKVGRCGAGESIRIPFRVEGVPEFSFELLSFKYLCSVQREPITDSVNGDSKYNYYAN